MALAHVKGYYLQQERQYIELLKYVIKVDEEYKAGNISEELYHEFEHDLQICKDNYLRIAYIMYLFDIPKSSKNKKKFAKTNQFFEEGFNTLKVDDLAIENENECVLKHAKEILEEAKRNAKQ